MIVIMCILATGRKRSRRFGLHRTLFIHQTLFTHPRGARMTSRPGAGAARSAVPILLLLPCASIAHNATTEAADATTNFANATSSFWPTNLWHEWAAPNSTIRGAWNRPSRSARARWQRTQSTHIGPAAARARSGSLRFAAAAAHWGRMRTHAVVHWICGASRRLGATLVRLLRGRLRAARQHWQSLVASARSLWRIVLRRDRAVSRVLRRAAAREWYALLKVRRRATKKQIKDAYRKLAKSVHPDKTKDDRAEAAFNLLRDAFEILSDTEQRARYDKELARADEDAARRRRAMQARARKLALRTVRDAARVGRAVSKMVWLQACEHPRVAAGVVLVLALLLAPT